MTKGSMHQRGKKNKYSARNINPKCGALRNLKGYMMVQVETACSKEYLQRERERERDKEQGRENAAWLTETSESHNWADRAGRQFKGISIIRLFFRGILGPKSTITGTLAHSHTIRSLPLTVTPSRCPNWKFFLSTLLTHLLSMHAYCNCS